MPEMRKNILFKEEQADVIEAYCQKHGLISKNGKSDISEFIRQAIAGFLQQQNINFPQVDFEHGGKRPGVGRPRKHKRRSHAPDVPPSGSTMA